MQIEPGTFYGSQIKPSNSTNQSVVSKKSSFVKTQVINLSKIKEIDQQQLLQDITPVAEDEMEEGAHFVKTQKIPISLINKQEKPQNTML